MSSRSTLEHEDKQQLGVSGEAAEQFLELEQMTMVSQTDWIWAQDTLGPLSLFFFPGWGVESRLQCWGCMYPTPRAMTKNMGHSLHLTCIHTHTHTLTRVVFCLFISVFFSSLIISSIIKLGEKLIILGRQRPQWCSFMTQHKKQTKSICWDLNLLMLLTNYGNNHLKRNHCKESTFFF